MILDEIWSDSYLPCYDVVPISSTVDDLGNVYVLGACELYTNGQIYGYAAIFILKYDRTGKVKWVAKQNFKEMFGISSIGLDHCRNCIISGTLGDDFITIKYNTSGEKLWEKKYKGSGKSEGNATRHVIDSIGNIYVAGSSMGMDKNFDYTIIKYDNNGAQKWIAYYNGPGDSTDIVADVAIDSLCNIYVTGKSWSGSSFDIVTIVYDSSGIEQKIYRYNVKDNSNDCAFDVALDSHSNIYIIGYSILNKKSNYVTIKYDRTQEEKVYE